jgi:hypothetical protein
MLLFFDDMSLNWILYCTTSRSEIWKFLGYCIDICNVGSLSSSKEVTVLLGEASYQVVLLSCYYTVQNYVHYHTIIFFFIINSFVWHVYTPCSISVSHINSDISVSAKWWLVEETVSVV